MQINAVFRIAGILTVCLSSSLPAAAVEPAATFFTDLKRLCGKAFAGTVRVDTPAGAGFSDQSLVMHVRECSEQEIRIPFHVGNDRSRTWVIRYDKHGLSLKHDHRHEDGSEDRLTQYGGTSTTAGYAQVQSFPADQFSQQMFVREAIPQSMDNTWQLLLYPNQFSYRMYRPAREFRVDFDLTKPIDAPPPPWGATE
ncbi:hypothetical protein [Alteromonas flava]|uniref:hypothetical protein n=1 Tax=Alteromonas flava TaxID=2048003 RepID=UPI000C286814|nr:hypothetical protein [Alteromonas flava]